MISARALGVRATRSATSSILASLLQITTSCAPSRADSLMRSSKEEARRDAGMMIASSLPTCGAPGEKSGDSTSTLCSNAEWDAFWRIFNHANYAAAKKVADPHNVFRDLYAKTCRAAHGLA